jgi:ribosome-associated translation inhibitor RaiA
MNLHVRVKGLDRKAEVRHDAERKLAATLNWLAPRVQNAAVLLEDVTGPHKQLVDKRCRIVVRLRRGGDLTIEERGVHIRAALALALDRLKAVISRRVGKVKRGIGAG